MKFMDNFTSFSLYLDFTSSTTIEDGSKQNQIILIKEKLQQRLSQLRLGMFKRKRLLLLLPVLLLASVQMFNLKCSYNPEQNIWRKGKEPSKFRQDQKTLISAFM